MSFSSAAVHRDLSSFLSGIRLSAEHRKDSRQSTRPVLLAATSTLDGLSKLVRYPFRLWVQVFVVYNTISVCRRHRPFWIWSEPCRLEQMNVNVLPTPSTPAHCLPSQCTAQDKKNRPSASNIAYDIVYDVVYNVVHDIEYDIILFIVYDIAYDVVYDIAYDIICDVLDKLSIVFYGCVHLPSESGDFCVQKEWLVAQDTVCRVRKTLNRF
jgi:hypothetical protein